MEYVSSNPEIIYIDNDGNMKGLKKGRANVTIIVTDEYGNEYRETCTVKVKYTFGQILLKIIAPWIKL